MNFRARRNHTFAAFVHLQGLGATRGKNDVGSQDGRGTCSHYAGFARGAWRICGVGAGAIANSRHLGSRGP